MTSISGNWPVVVGVGDFINRSTRIDDAVEPLDLMLSAITDAIRDTGLDDTAQRELQSSIDSLEVVLSWTWPYPDLPGSIVEKLRISPKYKATSPHGGNQPVKVFDDAAKRISKGEASVAIVVGGEALASCSSQIYPPSRHFS
jgi:acetyl-CoA acetyltransferase